MTYTERLEVEAQCQALVRDFALCIDSDDHERFLALFTEDAAFIRPVGSYRGKGQLRAFLQGRSPNSLVRHFCGNVQITVESATRASGKSYVLLLRTHLSDASIPGVMRLVEYEDRYRLEDERWYIEHREARPVMSWAMTAAPPD